MRRPVAEISSKNLVSGLAAFVVGLRFGFARQQTGIGPHLVLAAGGAVLAAGGARAHACVHRLVRHAYY